MFKLNNPIVDFLSKICDVMILSCIWFLFSIPIITIGASTTALYYTMIKLIRNEERYIISDFFNSFKLNFKQSTLIWIVMFALGLVIILDLFWYIMFGKSLKILSFIITFIAIIYCLIGLYIFPVLARFENSTKNLIKISFCLAIKHLFWTIIMLGVIYLTFIISLKILIVGVFSIGIIAFINSYILNYIFSFYNKAEQE